MIEKKIIELLREDVFVICVFDADVSRRSDAENKKLSASIMRILVGISRIRQPQNKPLNAIFPATIKLVNILKKKSGLKI